MMNQPITFLSDGGETVRNLQRYLSPQAEQVLDWFHITMRISTMRQMAKGLPAAPPLQDLDEELERVKCYLWHGNVFHALQVRRGTPSNSCIAAARFVYRFKLDEIA
jgi:hypothetical protein